MFGKPSAKHSTSTTKSATGTASPSLSRSTTSNNASTTPTGKTPIATKPGTISKRNSLDLKALAASTLKPSPIKVTSYSAASTPTIRSPTSARPLVRAPTQPSTPTSASGPRLSNRNSIGSRDHLAKPSESTAIKRTAAAVSNPASTRSTSTAAPPSGTGAISKTAMRSRSISGQQSSTTTPLTLQSATSKTNGGATRSTSANGNKEAISRRSSMDITPRRTAVPVDGTSRRSSVGSATPSRTLTPATKDRPAPSRSSSSTSSTSSTSATSSVRPGTSSTTSKVSRSTRPLSASLTNKDLPGSLRKSKSRTPTASLTSSISPSNSPMSSSTTSSSASKSAKGATASFTKSGPVGSPASNAKEKELEQLPVPPQVRHVEEQEEGRTTKIQEAMVEDVTPRESEETSTLPQLDSTLMLPPVTEEDKAESCDTNKGSNNESDNDDDRNTEETSCTDREENKAMEQDREHEHDQRHQYQVSSTSPAAVREQESAPSAPSTPTPTFKLFKEEEEDPMEAIQHINQHFQQQQQQQQQLPDDLLSLELQTLPNAMVNNSDISHDDSAIETLYAPEPSLLEAVVQVNEFEVLNENKMDKAPSALRAGVEVEAAVETTSITMVDIADESTISFTSAAIVLTNEGQAMEEKEPELETIAEVSENFKESEVSEEDEQETKTSGLTPVIEKHDVALLESEDEAKESPLVAHEEVVATIAIGGLVEIDIDEETQEQVASDEREIEDVATGTADQDALAKADLDFAQVLENQLVANENLVVPGPKDSEEPETIGDKTESAQDVELVETTTTVVSLTESSEQKIEADNESSMPAEPVIEEIAVIDIIERDPTLAPKEENLAPQEELSPAEEGHVATLSLPMDDEPEKELLGGASTVDENDVILLEDQASVSIVDPDSEVVKDLEIETAHEPETTETDEKVKRTIDEAHLNTDQQAETDTHLGLDAESKTDIETVTAVADAAVVDKDIQEDTTDLTELTGSVIEDDQSDLRREEDEEEIAPEVPAETIVDKHIDIEELAVLSKVTEETVVLSAEDIVESFEIPIAEAGDSEIKDDTEEVFVVETPCQRSVTVEDGLLLRLPLQHDVDDADDVLDEIEAEAEVKTDVSNPVDESAVGSVFDPTCVSYKFVWNHGGNSVRVTGTFDKWQASVELHKRDDAFEATVDLDRTKVIHFKFVVDGQWVCALDLEREFDVGGNENNVLHILV
ncbi:hypothetical protein BG004_008496 [Podila humilis]|nr:hypothetical protein BG004_008496 [Podila humilis]